ncbi:uncharacterized protein LOC132262165 [Phlebotomus argentipes]|uniref:uncharacterized protein LOC132262165 n=1 Tax=Phlebotomus argentipes TaxID=94469 RepID=UPI002892D628|nr:uncharacterized protein LOC132262165 [Phlebotomus argentipes]
MHCKSGKPSLSSFAIEEVLQHKLTGCRKSHEGKIRHKAGRAATHGREGVGRRELPHGHVEVICSFGSRYSSTQLPGVTPAILSWLAAVNSSTLGGFVGSVLCSSVTRSLLSSRTLRSLPTNSFTLGRPSWASLKAHDMFLLSQRTNTFTPVLMIFTRSPLSYTMSRMDSELK